MSGSATDSAKFCAVLHSGKMEGDKKETNPLLELCVGGQRFITTLDTLCARGPNFLVSLVENDATGRMKAKRDKKGAFSVRDLLWSIQTHVIPQNCRLHLH